MQRFIYMLWVLCTVAELRLSLYDTDPFEYDCLHYRPNELFILDIMKYCIRPIDNGHLTVIDYLDMSHPYFTFAELRLLHVTSNEILRWSFSIDIAERYQYYLNQPAESDRLNERFFN